MNFFIGIFLLAFFILAKARFNWALVFLLAALPLYVIRFNIFGLPFTLLEGMILIIFSLWIFNNFKSLAEQIKSKIKNQKSKINRYPFDWEIALILIISFTAAGVAGFSDSAMGVWKAYFFEPLLLYIVVFNVILERPEGAIGSREDSKNPHHLPLLKAAEKILWPLCISALAVSLFAIYQKITGDFISNPFWAAEATRRVTSFFGYPNAVGLFLGPLILLFAGWLISVILKRSEGAIGSRVKAGKILLIIAVICLSFLSIFYARSEGALIGIVAGLFVFGLLANSKTRLLSLGVAVILISAAFLFQPARGYVTNKFTLNDFSGQVRKLQWAETWQMLKDGRIITGSGLANYQSAIRPFHREGFFYNRDNDPDFHRKTVFNAEYRQAHWQPLEIYLYPHNIFLNFWTELGLIGMIIFIWIIGKFYCLGMRLIFNKFENFNEKNKYLIIGLLSAMTVIVVHGLVDVPYFKNDLSIIFWILVALMGIFTAPFNKGGEGDLKVR